MYEGMSFKGFLFLAQRQFCSAEGNDFSNFGKGSPKEHTVELQWLEHF